MKKISYVLLICLLPLVTWAQTGVSQYLFQGNDTVSVSGTIRFYDNGGPSGRYTNAAMGAVTFVPGVQGEVIKMVFNSINTKYNDYFVVLNGNIDGTQVASYSGTSLTGANLPLPIVSTAPNGALTVKFENITGTIFNGWDIEIQTIVPRPLGITNIVTTAVSTNKLLRGSQDEQMLKIEVTVDGEKDSLNIGKFAFSTASSTNTADIESASLYATDTLSVFSTNNRYASVTGANLIFEGETKIAKAGVYKFWLTYNIAATATVGNTVQAQLDSVVNRGIVSTPSVSNVASRNIEAGFSGNYTIGSSPTADYPTFATAIAAMSGGIDGAVVFTVENGTYGEQVVIPHIEGASAINSITFKSQNNDYNDVVLEKNNYQQPSGYGSSVKFGIFNIYGADYITVSGFTFKTSSNRYDGVVMIQNVSRHVTIDNCKVEAPRATAISENITLIKTQALNVAHKNNDYLTIKNCYLDGARVGLYIDGTGYVRLPKQKGAVVENNTLRNQGYMGIYMTREHDGVIRNNNIAVSGSIASGTKPIDVSLMGNTTVANNRIYADNTTNNSVYGIYLRRGNAEELQTGRNRVYNNEVIFDHVGGSYASYGIECADPIINTDIVYNSIYIVNNNNLFGAALHMQRNGTTDGVFIANNLFQNNANAFIYALNRADYLSGMSFSNNAYYTNNPELLANISSDTIKTLSAWQALTGETNAIIEQAQFVGSLSLDLAVVGNLASATPLNYVITDINNMPRSNTNPTIGAYEYLSVTPVPVFESGYPIIQTVTHNSVKVKVKLTENGKLFFVAKPSNAPQPTTDEILSGDSIAATKNVETEITVGSLNSNTEYKIYFVPRGMGGTYGTITPTAAFTTTEEPTQVSTFENVATTSGNFTDGTAVFTGFTVENITDGVGNNNTKAAKLTASSDTATVVINNSTQGLVLNGFYLKSDATTTLKAQRGAAEAGTRSVAATDGKWIFIDLKPFGQITGISLIGSGNVLIDNFSGTPQPIAFALNDTTVAEGNIVNFTADIFGGVPPYTFVWTNSHRDTLGNSQNMSLTAEKTGIITLVVTDAWSNSHKAKALLTVHGSAKVATFDDLYLAPETYWWGDTVSNYRNTFYSGSFSFANVLMPSYQAWGLFAYSNKTSTSYNASTWLTDQFNSTAGQGAHSSANYAVVYASNMMGNTITKVTHNTNGDTVSGCYITNNAWVKYVSLNGTGMNSTGQTDANTPFTVGDWYKLTATADNGKQLDFYLADYRDANNVANHYTLDSWQWFDLRALGAVKSIKFTVDGSRKNAQGLTIPAYFCLDELGGRRNLSHTRTIEVANGVATSFRLDTIFPVINAGGADVVYAIVDSVDGAFAQVAVAADRLSVLGSTNGERTMVVKRTVKGEAVFALITLRVEEDTPSSCHNAIAESLAIYPNPASEWFSVNIGGKLEIFTTDGRRVYADENYIAGNSININRLAQGSYLVKIGGKTIKLVVKR